jgi:hypothetical protein
LHACCCLPDKDRRIAANIAKLPDAAECRAKLPTRDEARRIAAGVARLPELLRAELPHANALVQGGEAG